MIAVSRRPHPSQWTFFHLDLVECENVFMTRCGILDSDAMLSDFYQYDFFAPARFSEINQIRAAVSFRTERNERCGFSEMAS